MTPSLSAAHGWIPITSFKRWLNLGRNAIQALAGAAVESPRPHLEDSRRASNVSVGAHRHRLVASIQFEDNGPGVLNEIRETIFLSARVGTRRRHRNWV